MTPLMPTLSRLFAGFDERVSARSLSMIRVVVGIASLLCAVDQLVKMATVIEPEVVHLPYIIELPRPDATWLALVILVWLITTVLFVSGKAAMLAGSILAAVMCYSLLLDQQTYSNHLYLLILLVVLVSVAEGTAHGRGASRTAAAWPIWLLRAQLSIVYGYSVIFKLNPDFLSGTMLESNLRTTGWLALPAAWLVPSVVVAFAVATLFVEGFLAIAFWFSRLRVLALVVGVGFHLAIVVTMRGMLAVSLLAFMFEMLAMYLAFFAVIRRWEAQTAHVQEPAPLASLAAAD